MEDAKDASADYNLESVLSKINKIFESVNGNTLDIALFNTALAPYLRWSKVQYYDINKRVLVENRTYELFGPQKAIFMKPEKLTENDGDLPSMIRNYELEMTSINAKGAALRDCFDSKKSIVTIDVQLDALLEEKPSTSINLTSLHQAIYIKNIVMNTQGINGQLGWTSIFFATDDNMQEGYLFVLGKAGESQVDINDFIKVNLSTLKSEDIRKVTNVEWPSRIYELKEGGKFKRQLKYGTAEFNEIGNALVTLEKSFADIKNKRYNVASLEVFLNGAKVELTDFVNDLIYELQDFGINYLKNYKPRVVNGRVEYTIAALAQVNQTGDQTLRQKRISYGLDDFLELTKVLYDGGKEMVKKELLKIDEKKRETLHEKDLSMMYQ